MENATFSFLLRFSSSVETYINVSVMDKEIERR